MDKETKEAVIADLRECKQDIQDASSKITAIQLNNQELHSSLFTLVQSIMAVQSELDAMIVKAGKL